MIELRVIAPGLDSVIVRLDELAARLRDLRWLAERIAEILVRQNYEARVAGLDATGEPFLALAPSTLKRRKGTGPPLAPEEGASKIANPAIEIIPLGDGAWRIALSWPDMPYLKYHVTGTPNMPARNPVGVTPMGWEQIRAAVDQAVAELLRGA
jgi:hypothetical protein